MPKRILVCGDRNWRDYLPIAREIINQMPTPNTVIIHGACRGADTLAAHVAGWLGLRVESYPAQWQKYGKGAGPIRNQQMLDEGKPDLVLAFHPNLAHSKGTKDMVKRARKARIEVRVFTE